jgi:aryl-alcohol dehydrogenase-like predicted oxidoreductase
MRSVQLGPLAVSAQGLGCMSMSSAYGAAKWEESVATLERALDLGVTLLDTADIYGQGHNEVLVGRAIAGRRDQVVLATKCGIDRSGGDANQRLRGDKAYVQQACEASLLRLDVEVIDLFYLHRASNEVEIEETISAFADLVTQGKVRHIGLSQVSAEQLRRAHRVHPIAAVQSEYSLWTRDIEDDVLPVLRELGVGLVPFSPLGRGYLTATVDTAALEASDFRRHMARFQDRANEAITATITTVAQNLNVTPAQVALAWVYAQQSRYDVTIVPIPGTKRIQWLEDNLRALEVELSERDLADLEPIATQVVGARFR